MLGFEVPATTEPSSTFGPVEAHVLRNEGVALMGERSKGKDKGKAKKKPKAAKPGRRPHEQQREEFLPPKRSE